MHTLKSKVLVCLLQVVFRQNFKKCWLNYSIFLPCFLPLNALGGPGHVMLENQFLNKAGESRLMLMLTVP